MLIITTQVFKINTKQQFLPNNENYPNFGGFSQTFGVNTKTLGFYTLGTHYSWGYPNFVELPKSCYLDVEGETQPQGQCGPICSVRICTNKTHFTW